MCRDATRYSCGGLRGCDALLHHDGQSGSQRIDNMFRIFALWDTRNVLAALHPLTRPMMVERTNSGHRQPLTWPFNKACLNLTLIGMLSDFVRNFWVTKVFHSGFWTQGGLPQCIHGTGVTGSLKGFAGLHRRTLTMTRCILSISAMTSLDMQRGREVDIDRTLHADNAPDKRNEAMQFMEPLAIKIVDLMESLQPAKQENLTRHKIAELEQQLERYKSKGITLTPDKKLPSSSPSNAASWTPTPGRSDQSLYINAANSDQPGPSLPVPSPEADPAPKRRPAKRKTPGAPPDVTLDSDLLRQGNPKGQQVPLPTSLTDKVFKAWLQERTLSNQANYLDLIKQELASDTVEQLKAIAVKWGATVSLVSKGSKRALLQFITVMYMYGK